MTGARDITQLCFSSILAGIVANKIEQSSYSNLVLHIPILQYNQSNAPTNRKQFERISISKIKVRYKAYKMLQI